MASREAAAGAATEDWADDGREEERKRPKLGGRGRRMRERMKMRANGRRRYPRMTPRR